MKPERLKQLRLARGLSMDGLVARMDGFVSKQALSFYERGKMQPSDRVLEALAKALEVRPDELQAEPPVRVEFLRFRKKALLRKKEQSRLLNLLQFELETRERLQSLVLPGRRPE